MKRREAILSATAGITGLAGCSVLSSQAGTLSVSVFNHAESSYTIELGMFEGRDKSRPEARQYSRSIDVESAGQTRVDDIVEMGSYLLRYEVYENRSCVELRKDPIVTLSRP
jgi:hypothetical protein